MQESARSHWVLFLGQDTNQASMKHPSSITPSLQEGVPSHRHNPNQGLGQGPGHGGQNGQELLVPPRLLTEPSCSCSQLVLGSKLSWGSHRHHPFPKVSMTHNHTWEGTSACAQPCTGLWHSTLTMLDPTLGIESKTGRAEQGGLSSKGHIPRSITPEQRKEGRERGLLLGLEGDV